LIECSRALTKKLLKGYEPLKKLIGVMDELIWFMADDGSK